MPPRVLVTRPAGEAARWVQGLAECGIDAVALPLIDIVAEPAGEALDAARTSLAACDAAMFVSAHAATAFLQPISLPALVGVACDAIKTRAWATGPGTTAALRRAGWPAERLDAPTADAPQFDSEALWARVRHQAGPGRRVLIVRGGDACGRALGRPWLAEQLQAAGAQVDQVVAYRRVAPVLDAAQRALALSAATDTSLWLFSSSEAVANLCAALPTQDWRAARALATHPRIAQTAREAGFGSVTDTQPTLDAVVASIESGA